MDPNQSTCRACKSSAFSDESFMLICEHLRFRDDGLYGHDKCESFIFCSKKCIKYDKDFDSIISSTGTSVWYLIEDYEMVVKGASAIYYNHTPGYGGYRYRFKNCEQRSKSRIPLIQVYKMISSPLQNVFL